MKYLLVLVVFLFGCATGDRTPEQISQDNVKRELGWRKALLAYDAEIDRCTPVKTDSCILTVEDTERVDEAIDSFRALRNSCLTFEVCDSCGLAQAAFDIAEVIGEESLVDVSVCRDTEVDIILSELESIEVSE